MICGNYKELIIPKKLNNQNWEKALAWLKSDAWKDLPQGRTDIDPGFYVLHSTRMSKLRSECQYETHRRYADIQMAIKGSDLLLVSLPEELKIAVPYSEEKDIDFLEGEPEKGHEIVLGFPLAVVLFPLDAHMPNVAMDNKPGETEKVVLKIAL